MTASPWQSDDPASDPLPPSGAPPRGIEASEAVYRVLWKTLRNIADVSEDLPVSAAIMGAVDLGIDLAIASGADIAAALRELADNLDDRRNTEPPQRTFGTLRETLAIARPAAN
jgi:hypothetical protein